MLQSRSLSAIALMALALALLVGADSVDPPTVTATHLCGETGSTFGPFDVAAYDPEDFRSYYNETFNLAAVDGLFPGDLYFGLPPLETGPRPEPTPVVETPTETATATPTLSPMPTLTGTPTPGPTPSITPSPTPSATPSPTPSPTPFPPIGPGLVEPHIPPTILKAIGWVESGWAQAAFAVPYGEIGPALISHDCGYGIMQVTSGMQNTTGQPTREQLMTAAHYAYNIARGTRILADKWNLAPEFRPIVGDRNPEVIEDWYYAVWSYNGFVFTNHPLNPRFPAWPRTSYSCGPFDDGFSHDRSQYPYQELVFGCMAHPPELEGTPLWPPQEVTLPDLSLVDFAQPLALENFACDTSDYCYDGMDMPRPESAHADPTETGGDRSRVVGSPALEVSTSSVELAAVPGSVSQPYAVTISNPGSGILVWTATSSASWLQPSWAQGLALSNDLGGDASALTIQANMAGLPRGRYVGTITLEAPYVADGPKTITVTVNSLSQSFVPGVTKS